MRICIIVGIILLLVVIIVPSGKHSLLRRPLWYPVADHITVVASKH